MMKSIEAVPNSTEKSDAQAAITDLAGLGAILA
jgi:hypothetical protein